MEFRVLRGADKIGGNLIEFSCGGTKVLVEFGIELDNETGGLTELEREIIATGYDAVIVSHYHGDHAGNIKELKCPVYMGAGCLKVMAVISEFVRGKIPNDVRTFRAGVPFEVGAIKITAFLCDHSAFDSYMLLLEGGGKKVLYTGDFRSGGRKSFKKLLSVLPFDIDVLIHEGTNLSIGREPKIKTEEELEAEAVKVMKASDKPVFILQSSANIDSLVSFYRAAKRTGRRFYMDDFHAAICFAVGGKIPNPDSFDDVFAYASWYIKGARYDKFQPIKKKKSAAQISKDGRAVILVRQYMAAFLRRLDKYSQLKGAILVYSLWEGYKQKDEMKAFLRVVDKLGIDAVSLHTSGHADRAAVEMLKQTVNAKEIIMIHTECK